MEDEEKSSFHGSLSRFAYVSSSSTSSFSPPPSHDQTPERSAWFAPAPSTPCPIEEGDNCCSKQSRVSPVNLSHKRKGNSGGRRTDARSRKRQKLGNAGAVGHTRLSGIPDCVGEDLDVLFCGINPGHMSAVTGHHYANPTNHFWHCLHLSGFTPRLLIPSEDCTLPERYNLGLINLVERPTTSQADLSAQEMTSSVPAVLTKIARCRPRVTCFIGKGIWLHVERALSLLKVGNENAGIGDDQSPLGAQAQGHVAEPAKTPVASKDQRSAYFHLAGDTADIERLAKAEPGRRLDFCGVVVKPDESGSDVLSKQSTKSGGEETVEITPGPSLIHSTTRRGGISSAPRPASEKAKAPARAFAYGLQPLKAVHNSVPHSASAGETLFCVLPSTSGRVVSHQRDDKVALFKELRENLERIKVGTLDTRSMRIIRLQTDSH